MIKLHKEEVTQVEDIIDDVVCNCCGNPISLPKDYLDINKSWGYFSNHDTETHKCQICEDCCMKIASTFKIPVEIEDYI